MLRLLNPKFTIKKNLVRIINYYRNIDYRTWRRKIVIRKNTLPLERTGFKKKKEKKVAVKSKQAILCIHLQFVI